MFVMLRHVWNYHWTLCFPVTCFSPHLTFSFNLFSYFLTHQKCTLSAFSVFKSIASKTGSWIQRDNPQTVILTFCSATGNGLCFIGMVHRVWYVWCSDWYGLFHQARSYPGKSKSLVWPLIHIQEIKLNVLNKIDREYRQKHHDAGNNNVIILEIWSQIEKKFRYCDLNDFLQRG